MLLILEKGSKTDAPLILEKFLLINWLAENHVYMHSYDEESRADYVCKEVLWTLQSQNGYKCRLYIWEEIGYEQCEGGRTKRNDSNSVKELRFVREINNWYFCGVFFVVNEVWKMSKIHLLRSRLKICRKNCWLEWRNIVKNREPVNYFQVTALYINLSMLINLD